MMSLDTMKAGQSEMVFVKNAHIKVERTPRGSYATVKSGRLAGKYFFASTPQLALDCLVDQLAPELDYGYFTREQRIASYQLDMKVAAHLDVPRGEGCGSAECNLCATYYDMTVDK